MTELSALDFGAADPRRSNGLRLQAGAGRTAVGHDHAHAGHGHSHDGHDHGHRHDDHHSSYGLAPTPPRGAPAAVRISPSLLRAGAATRLTLVALTLVVVWAATLSVVG